MDSNVLNGENLLAAADAAQSLVEHLLTDTYAGQVDDFYHLACEVQHEWDLHGKKVYLWCNSLIPVYVGAKKTAGLAKYSEALELHTEPLLVTGSLRKKILESG